jgi:hypothetical protein
MRFPDAITTLLIVGIITLALAACANDPVDTGHIKSPSWRLMEDPGNLPATPENDGDPKVRADYYAKVRGQYNRARTQLMGLQRYARSVTKER